MMTRPKAKTFRRTITSAIVRAVLVTGGLVGGYTVSAHTMPINFVFPESSEAAVVATAPTDAERLIEAHDCWTSEAPADMQGVIPGHVVVTRDGETVYGGARLTSLALEQIFDGTDHGLSVAAFCR